MRKVYHEITQIAGNIITVEATGTVMDVNVNGTFYMCKAVLPDMVAKRYGKIVNVTSIAGKIGDITASPVYGTSKGAVNTLTRSLARQMAEYNITVNAMLPGPFATEMNLPLKQDPDTYAAFVAKIPLGRWGELEEIQGLAVFLASDASSFGAHMSPVRYPTSSS